MQQQYIRCKEEGSESCVQRILRANSRGKQEEGRTLYIGSAVKDCINLKQCEGPEGSKLQVHALITASSNEQQHLPRAIPASLISRTAPT